jgi:hypothetical protein
MISHEGRDRAEDRLDHMALGEAVPAAVDECHLDIG